MLDKWCTFDIETSRIIPKVFEGDIFQFSPLQVSTAAVHVRRGDKEYTQSYFSRDDTGAIQPRMSKADVKAYVEKLEFLRRSEFPVFSWCGTGFDWRILAEESGELKLCADLCLNHYDIAFQFLMTLGYFISLETAAEKTGMKKFGGVHGADAPQLWVDGQYDLARAYVEQDCRVTSAVVDLVLKDGEIRWVSRGGFKLQMRFDQLLTVKECLNQLKMPDQSWMTKKIVPSDLLAWTKEVK